MKPVNVLYAQSGGVTAVINATAAAVIRAARAQSQRIGNVFGARHGVLGMLSEDLVDTAQLSETDLGRLALTPGGAFGSCRFDLRAPQDDPAQYDRLFDVFAAHRIGVLLYNGGNGSMDTVVKLSAAARERGFPLCCIGVPKTVDNDIEGTDCSPGFASAGKYLAISMLEAGLDLVAMSGRRGRVFIMEVMGRNTGWLAAATALATRGNDDSPPHIVLLPEVPFNETAFIDCVRATVERLGYCAITVAEGIRRADGSPVLARGATGAYVQLGGAGLHVAHLIEERFGYLCHWAIPDYLQRAAGHWRSATDLAQAEAVGAAAIDYALAGRDGVMPAIRRLADDPYRWDVVPVDAAAIANLERPVPPAFIRADGLHVSAEACRYLRPLIQGDVAVSSDEGGLPVYGSIEWQPLARRLPPYPG